MLAGDCLTSLGLVTGLQRRHRTLSLIWLDAHGDFNTPAISASGYLAGMTLAMLTGRASEPICERLGLRPVPDDHAVLIDARILTRRACGAGGQPCPAAGRGSRCDSQRAE